MKAIADGHAAVAGEHARRDLEVSTVGVLVALLTETSRGVEVVGEVVDGDFHLIGGDVCPREGVKVIEEKAVPGAEEASTRSMTVPLTAERFDQKRKVWKGNGCKMAEVELVTMFR